MMLKKLPFVFIFGWFCHKYGEPLTKVAFPSEGVNRLMSYGEGGLMIWATLEFMLAGMGFDKHERNKVSSAFGLGVSALGLGVLMSFMYNALFGEER